MAVVSRCTPLKERPVTDAKEVGWGTPWEETFCHRTVAFMPILFFCGNPFVVIHAPFIAPGRYGPFWLRNPGWFV